VSRRPGLGRGLHQPDGRGVLDPVCLTAAIPSAMRVWDVPVPAGSIRKTFSTARITFQGRELVGRRGGRGRRDIECLPALGDRERRLPPIVEIRKQRRSCRGQDTSQPSQPSAPRTAARVEIRGGLGGRAATRTCTRSSSRSQGSCDTCRFPGPRSPSPRHRTRRACRPRPRR
jgi:hypothetical protein